MKFFTSLYNVGDI